MAQEASRSSRDAHSEREIATEPALPAPAHLPPGDPIVPAIELHHPEAHQTHPAEPRRRRVQWLGLTDEDEDAGRRAGISHDGHTAVPMQTPEEPRSGGDYFSAGESSDGTNTPGYSSANTPEASRPGTPEFEGLDIDSGERDGLPTAGPRSAKAFSREAAKLVAAHKAKNRFKALGERNRADGVDAVAVAAALRADLLRKGNEVKGQQPAAAPSASTSRAKPAGGVLSSLLRLYEQPQSLASSQATLVDSGIVPPRPTASARDSFDGFGDALRSFGRSAGSAISRATPFVDVVERPAQARSSGGVFAALQAGALDLAGPAAPHNTTIRPATSRPGYRVKCVTRRGRANACSRLDLTADEPDTSPPTSSGANTPGGLSSRPGHKGSPPTGSGATTPGDFSSRSGHKGSHLSLSQLGDVFSAKSFYNESNVLKAAKANSQPSTPQPEYVDEKPRQAQRRKHKKRQDEIFITMHVAAILQRQDFILRLSRALMMFGAPSHRLEMQIQATAKTLELRCSVIYLVNFMIISFQDDDTHTSDIRFIKQSAGLDLAKLTQLSTLHHEVVHDLIGVQEASIEISNLMRSPPAYNKYLTVVIGGLCSLFIAPASFNASLIDMLVAFLLGCLLCVMQIWVASKSDVLAAVFEIFVVGISSFVAAALASTGIFCYTAITSAAIVLVLPGFGVCCAALELQSKSVVCGSVRLVYALFYALLLGYGISIGASFWTLFSGDVVNTATDGTCSTSHGLLDGETSIPLWRRTLSTWFAFLVVPGFSLAISLRNGAVLRNKETYVMIVFACAGWTANHFAAIGFPYRSDVSAALAAFAVGLLGNLYGRLSRGLSFVVTVTPVLFMLPSGLGNGGILASATYNFDQSSTPLQNAFSVFQQLLNVSIGIVIGLFASLAVTRPFGGRRGGLFTF